MISRFAKRLDNAQITAAPIRQLSLEQKFDLDKAYAIQQKLIDLRKNRDEKLIGLKMGFTSKAKMEQMGVSDLIWGRLTDEMKIKEGSTLDLSKFVHPRAEPEIAFLIKKDVNEILNLNNAKDYIEASCAAIEIIDSRYENFKFSLEDVIADNCSSSKFLTGEWRHNKTDVNNLSMELCFDDEVVQSGNSSAIMGNPLQSLVDASRLALKYNEPIKEGMIILAGASTPAVFLKENSVVSAKVEGFDTISFKVA